MSCGWLRVRIGEVATRTGVPARLIRYYEAHGLLSPQRLDNGYRTYTKRHVDRVNQIRTLLEAGLPTRIIKRVLPCLDSPQTVFVNRPEPDTIALLAQELANLDRKIDSLVATRESLRSYLASTVAGVPSPNSGAAP